MKFRRSIAARITLMVVGTLGAYLLAATVWTVLCDPIGLGGDCMPWVPKEPTATGALWIANPDPWSPSGEFLGMDRFDAPHLNRVHPEREFGRSLLQYVPASAASSGPRIVSVNPVDRFTWSAAAFSTQTRLCYTILSTHDPSNPQYGDTKYGTLGDGMKCAAINATPASVTGGDWPYVRVRTGSWIAIGSIMIGVGVVLVTLSHLFAIRRKPNVRFSRVGRWALFWIGIIGMALGTVPLAEGLG